MMLYRSPDGSFIIHSTTNSLAAPRCLHVQPGYQTFPARCKLPALHAGDHEGAVMYIGMAGSELFAPEKWGRDDD